MATAAQHAPTAAPVSATAIPANGERVMVRRRRKIIRAIIGWPALMIGIFFLAVLFGSIFPANNSWQEPADGIELFIESNGVHVGLILPMQGAGEDMSDIIQPRDLSDPTEYGTHAMIGWGHAGVYQRGRRWADVRASDVIDAASGSDDVLFHISHRQNPVPAPHRKSLRVTPAQYRYMVSEIRRNFRRDENGAPVASPAYGADDVFYRAKGHYSALNTCNEWIADLLRHAGIRVGIWMPFSGGVMRWF